MQRSTLERITQRLLEQYFSGEIPRARVQPEKWLKGLSDRKLRHIAILRIDPARFVPRLRLACICLALQGIVLKAEIRERLEKGHERSHFPWK